ncbi:MAG: RnfABCDGE type electron transport complex subunit D [Paludibacteraceae bacterium]|nr:RnfABCDGE type electron transport complex subunit D [Paludibacteraceae bacterium]
MIVSPSPHIHNNDSVRRDMLNVLIALLPAYIITLFYFGSGAVYLTALSICTCMLCEHLIQKFVFKKPSQLGNLSAIVTGALLALNLPSNLDWWIVIIGAIVAIGIGKMTFGGLGQNPFNPALVGRVFLLVSFPAQMTTWPKPSPMHFEIDYTDVETGATYLTQMKEGLVSNPDYADLFIGSIGGSMGEISAIALLIGFIYLICTKTITWHIPVSIVTTVFVFTGIVFLVAPEGHADPLIHIMTGGLLLGSVFMATDYATSPMTHKGQLIYGVGIGIITSVIRLWGAYPEGVSFAILIMNAATPLINHYVKPTRFGETVKKEGK